MAIVKDCINLTCDRCGFSDYYTSHQYAENVGWDINANVTYCNQRTDLCPKCTAKWDKLVHNFLYGEINDAE